MASGLLTDYLKHGNAADRPATPDLYTAAFGLWWNDDTQTLDLWDGVTWLGDIVSGDGVPAGGTTGQVLAKASGTDYDVEWVDQTGGGGLPDAPSDGTTYGRKDGAWAAVPGGGATAYTVVTEASAFTATPAAHAGLGRYIRVGGNVTFDGAEGYTAGQAFNIRATAGISLAGSGVTLTPPAGGSLALSAGMSVSVVMVTGTTADVVGQTVPA